MSAVKHNGRPGGDTRQRGQSPKWRYIYFLLAAFDLVTVSAGLYLNHRIMNIYTQSVEVNRIWAERVAAYSQLGEVAADVNAPGNDVFDNRNVPGESVKMHAASERFDRDLAERQQELKSNLEPGVAAPLQKQLDAIAGAKAEMTSEAERIFGYFREARPDLAGERMATMDHKYAHLNGELLELRRAVGKIQEQNFIQQTAAAADLQRYEYLIGLSILLMVAGATFYGHKIARQMQADAEDKQRHFEELAAAEARTRSILDTAAEGILTFDARGRIESFNKAAESLFGYAQSETIGRDIRALIPALAAFLATRAGVPRSEETSALCVVDGDCVGRRRGGSEFPVELSVSTLRLGDASIYNAIVRDISDRQRVEEAQRVAAAAQAASRAKSQFLANMSHEVRTPMCGVLGMTEMLLETELSPTQRSLAETVHRSGESLLGIIDDILDISKIEAGKLELECVDFNPHDLTEEVAQMLADAAEKKGIELVCHVADDVPRALRGAPSRLRQVLTNLVGNAVKFTEKGQVTIEVTPVATPAANDASGGGATVLHFVVADTGIGIALADQERLFTAFTQADSSMTRRYGGTGLGLAISKDLVERMGGRIGVRSTPGQGAEFWFTLRLEPARDLAPEPPAATVDLGGRWVLIVAGNPTTRRIIAQHLRTLGIEAQSAELGYEGLGRLRQAGRAGTPFELAIVDAKLPDCDAIEFGRAVQIDASIVGVRLIMLAPPPAGSGERPPPLEAGFLAHVAKPIRQAELCARVAEVLSNSVASVSNPAQAGKLIDVRVLLAEDNPVNQAVTRTMLESMGCQVRVADHGAAALAELEKSPFDIVLMDRQMPEMDGFDATAEIRSRRLLRRRQPTDAGEPLRLPIVGLTASAIKGDREIFLAAGMDDYLTKPFRRDDLRAIIERWALDRPSAVVAVAGEVADTFDRRTLEQIGRNQRPGAPSVVGDLIDHYFSEAMRLIAALRRAAEGGDGDALARAAETLGSASAFLGAGKLAGICGELERRVRAGPLPEAETLLGDIEREFAAVRSAMLALRPE